jgi:hypothetical protein
MPARPLSSRAVSLSRCACDLEAVFASWVRFDPGGPFRNRIFDQWTTFWLFLAQTLDKGGTCREAVRRAQAALSLHGGQQISPSDSAYCQARARLPLEALNREWRRTGKELESAVGPRDLWLGRRVKVLDGSSCSMPDTAQNQAKYPQSKRQKPGCGFPMMRLVALFSLATGALLAVQKGAMKISERALWRRMWPLLKPGDVVLGDRGFCSFAEIWSLLQREVDTVLRLNAHRCVGVRRVRRLGKNDWLVEWIKTKVRPRWMDPETWTRMGDTLLVRQVSVAVDIPGFRTQTLQVVTTLTDPKRFPARAIAELYRRRWRAELFLRDLKITLGMDVLRCKSPRTIHRELAMHLIAHNLIRALLWEAANKARRNPYRLSFAGAIAAVRQWAPALARLAEAERTDAFDALLNCIARDVLPFRPNRVEPRAIKRRPKNYQRLTAPRHAFTPAPHRSKYTTAALS